MCLCVCACVRVFASTHISLCLLTLSCLSYLFFFLSCFCSFVFIYPPFTSFLLCALVHLFVTSPLANLTPRPLQLSTFFLSLFLSFLTFFASHQSKFTSSEHITPFLTTSSPFAHPLFHITHSSSHHFDPSFLFHTLHFPHPPQQFTSFRHTCNSSLSTFSHLALHTSPFQVHFIFIQLFILYLLLLTSSLPSLLLFTSPSTSHNLPSLIPLQVYHIIIIISTHHCFSPATRFWFIDLSYNLRVICV